MNKSDFDKFSTIWVSASEIYNVSPSDGALTLSFQALRNYDIAEVQAAVFDFIATSQYPPKPSDIIGKLIKSDGRPDANEAWSIALNSFDENSTVILNEDIAAALEYCRDIYLDGDKTGARLAFRDTYEKRVAQARQVKQPLRWFPSLGHDKASRESVLRDAVVKGLLPAAHVDKLLPAPITREGQKVMTAVSHALLESDKADPEVVAASLAAMMQTLKR